MPETKIAAFFDLDNTLVRGFASLYFLKEMYRRKFIRVRDIARQIYEGTRFKYIGENTNLMKKVAQEGIPFGNGVDYSWLEDILTEVYDKEIVPKLNPKAISRLKEHQEAGHDTYVITASPNILAKVIKKKLNMTEGFGTLEDLVDGKFTGKLKGDFLHAERKQTLVRLLAQDHGYDLDECYAYSDSVNDIPLLKSVGKPTAVRPDFELRRYAKFRDWDILK
ncbi:MAG: HAD-IB family hydrolase [Micrococcaceae bacterium]